MQSKRGQVTDRSRQFAIGIDLGGTKVAVGVVDSNGVIHASQHIFLNGQFDPQHVKEQIIFAVNYLQSEFNQPLAGIGIGVAGQVDAETGEIIFAPNLNWHSVNLKQPLEDIFKLPVEVINDVRAITLAEWYYGIARGFSDFICLFIGTGIGGGVVSGGRLLTGCSNTLGEMGHIKVAMNGLSCTCGSYGCLEAYVSGWSISKQAREQVVYQIDSGLDSTILQLAGGDSEKISAKHVAEAYALGDPVAKKIIDSAVNALITGCSSLVNAFNPCRLIIGGGLVKGLPSLVNTLKLGISTCALKAALKNFDVLESCLGENVGTIGAASLILKPNSSAKI